MVRLTDRPDMTLDVYRGRKTTIQQPYSLHYMTLIFLIRLDSKNVDPYWRDLYFLNTGQPSVCCLQMLNSPCNNCLVSA